MLASHCTRVRQRGDLEASICVFFIHAGEDGAAVAPSPQVYVTLCCSDGSLAIFSLPDMKPVFRCAGFLAGRQLLAHEPALAGDASQGANAPAAGSDVYVKELLMESFQARRAGRLYIGRP